MRQFTVTFTSNLAAPLPAIWQKVSTLEGVNQELAPLVKMTAPPDMQRFPLSQTPIGQPIFASWLLLFRLLPFDRHRLQLDEVWEGGFRENSSSLIQRVWRHERLITPNATGCTLTDTVQFEPRLPLIGHLLLPIIRTVFQHRHHHLRRWFN